MKIRKIQKIKKLGIFKDFSWRKGMEDFEQDNLIYGWNCSGKTTLSRLFRMLEKKENYTDMIDAEFELELEDDSKITNQDIGSHNLEVQVFNKEYVEETFKEFQGRSVDPIYIALGENKGKKEELDNKKEELASKSADLQDKKEQMEQKQKDLEGAKGDSNKYKTDQAKQIKEWLPLQESFNKTNLENRLKEKTSTIGSDQDVQKKLGEYRQQAQDKIEFNKSNDVDISKEKLQEIKSILSKKVSLTETIKNLENDSERMQWAQKGLELHQESNACSFCDNTITPNRIKKLESFFSDEYKNTQEKVDECRQYLEGVEGKVSNMHFPNKAQLIQSKQNEFEALNCEGIKTAYLKKIKELITLVDQKGKDVTKVVPDDMLDDQYTFNLKKLEELVQENNNAIENLNDIKKKAKEALIDHYVERIRKEIERKEKSIKTKEKEHSDVKDKKESIEKDVKKIEGDIKELEATTSNMDAGLDKVNRVIQEFLGHEELMLEKVDDENNAGNDKKFLFALKREGRPAKNLSEGEKTIISFAYFFTKLDSIENKEQSNIGGDGSMKSKIVFLDDPISSLDDQHLSCMASFILYNLRNECKQLFISTHNFAFFDSLRKSERNRINRINRKFFIEAKKASASSNDNSGDDSRDNGRVAELKDLPKLIDEHKGEYHYMFKLIYDFSKEQDPNEYLMFPSIPNAFRNFLETYRNLQYPGENPQKQLERFIKDDSGNTDKVLIGQIISEAHRGSHSSGADSTRPVLDNPAIWQEMIKKVLRCIEKNTEDHFKCLERCLKEKE